MDKTCKCRCRLDASICNNKRRWNDDKCKCECNELIDKGKDLMDLKDLTGILAVVSVNVINQAILENI